MPVPGLGDRAVRPHPSYGELPSGPSLVLAGQRQLELLAPVVVAAQRPVGRLPVRAGRLVHRAGQAVITVDASTSKPRATNGARSSAEPPAPSTPNVRCRASGNSRDGTRASTPRPRPRPGRGGAAGGSPSRRWGSGGAHHQVGAAVHDLAPAEPEQRKVGSPGQRAEIHAPNLVSRGTIGAWIPRPAATAPATASVVLDLTAIAPTSPPAAGDGLLHVFVPHATAGIAILETGAGSDEDLLAALGDLLPADDRWRHRHGSPRPRPLARDAGPRAAVRHRAGARRPARARHLAEHLPGRPQRRQRGPRGAVQLPVGPRVTTLPGAPGYGCVPNGPRTGRRYAAWSAPRSATRGRRSPRCSTPSTRPAGWLPGSSPRSTARWSDTCS